MEANVLVGVIYKYYSPISAKTELLVGFVSPLRDLRKMQSHMPREAT